MVKSSKKQTAKAGKSAKVKQSQLDADLNKHGGVMLETTKSQKIMTRKQNLRLKRIRRLNPHLFHC